MNITVNGQTREVPEQTTLQFLLESAGVNRQQVAVEVNSELVPREQHQLRVLKPGDAIEIVTLVGGG